MIYISDTKYKGNIESNSLFIVPTSYNDCCDSESE